MALSRFEVNSGQKGKGLPHYLYITGQDGYVEKNTEIIFVRSENMPNWVQDPREFWGAGDEFERKNGSVYREHLLSLPRELTHAQNIQLIDDWVKKHLDGYTYTYAYHETFALDGGLQPHCHLMFSERVNDGIERTKEQYFKRYNPKNPERGGVKKQNTGKSHAERKQELLELRESFGEHLREHLRRNGHEKSAELVDMRNYIERGAEQPEPQKPIWVKQAEKAKAYAQRLIDDIEKRAQSFENTRTNTAATSQKITQTNANDAQKSRTNRDDDFDFDM